MEFLKLVFGWVLLVASSSILLGLLYAALRNFRRAWFRMIRNLHLAGASLCAIGGGLKFLELGPEWVRFHISDLGFPFAVAYLVCARREGSFWVDAKSRVDSAKATLEVGRWWRLGMVLALGLSITYEIVSGLVVAELRSRGIGPVAGVGGFDVVDIVCSTVGAALGYLLWTLWIRDSRVLLESALADAAGAAPESTATEIKPIRAKEPRKPRKGRRGGRI